MVLLYVYKSLQRDSKHDSQKDMEIPRTERSGQFRGQKGLGPLEKSLELSHYELCPLKKNNLPHFPNQRYINS